MNDPNPSWLGSYAELSLARLEHQACVDRLTGMIEALPYDAVSWRYFWSKAKGVAVVADVTTHVDQTTITETLYCAENLAGEISVFAEVHAPKRR